MARGKELCTSRRGFIIQGAARGRVRGYEEAAQRLFAAEEWVESQDWTGKEEPCAVQVALKQLGRCR